MATPKLLRILGSSRDQSTHCMAGLEKWKRHETEYRKLQRLCNGHEDSEITVWDRHGITQKFVVDSR